MTIKCQLPKLECDIDFGVPVVSVLSFIFSLWTIKYVIKSVTESFGYEYGDYRDDILAHPMVHTYLLLAFSTCILLYNGFKNKDKLLIQYWVLFKYVEFSLITFAAFIYYLFLVKALLFVSFILLGVGYYILYTVKSGYTQLGIELDPVSISNLLRNFKTEENNKCLEKNDCDNDNEETDKNLSPFAASILRQWGYMILLQIIIIFPFTIIIIINCNILPSMYRTYDYLNISYFSIGIGILFILCILYICKILPNKASTINTKEVEVLVNNE